ncbi:DUF963 domain-containing protein [Candidatus Saccharibacteria bacterium]|nr:DUF963 domain-containing protein [Candidatus Saccharibacteria bacterium]
MNPSTGNDFNGGNVAGQGVGNGTPANNGVPVNGGAPIGSNGMPVNNSVPVRSSVPIRNGVPVNGGAPVGGAAPVNGAVPVGNRVPVSGVAPESTGMPVGGGDIVLNTGLKGRKKTKVIVIIVVLVVLIIAGACLALYFVNENNLKKDIGVKWSNYYNMLVYGSVEKPEEIRDSISNEPSKWFLNNLDNGLEKMGYVSSEQYYNDLKNSYDTVYGLIKGKSALLDSDYNGYSKSFFIYNLRFREVELLEKEFIENGYGAASEYLNSLFIDSDSTMDYYLKEYFNDRIKMMQIYDSDSCYDSVSLQDVKLCKDSLSNNELMFLNGRLDRIVEEMMEYYNDSFLPLFCYKTLEFNKTIGEEL